VIGDNANARRDYGVMNRSRYSRDDDRRYMSYEQRAAEDSRFVKKAKVERNRVHEVSYEVEADRHVARCSCSWSVVASSEAAVREQARVHVIVESR